MKRVMINTGLLTKHTVEKLEVQYNESDVKLHEGKTLVDKLESANSCNDPAGSNT